MRGYIKLLALGGLLMAGCSTTAKIESWQPAALDVEGMHRIAVLDFDGPQGGEAAAALSTRLQASGFYQIVDRSQWLPVFESVADTQSDRLQATWQMGHSLGLDAVVVGTVRKYDCQDQSIGTTLAGNVSIGVGKVNRHAEVTIALQVLDVRTGKIRLEDVATRTIKADYYADDDLPKSERLLRGMWDECFDELAGKLAPQRKEVEVKLADASWFQTGGSKIREGNGYARKANWPAAQQAWQAALQADPESHAAMYNLALACEAQRDYAGAEAHLQQALAKQNNGRYTAALARVQQERIDFTRAEQQRLARSNSAPRTAPAIVADQARPAGNQRFPAPSQRNPDLGTRQVNYDAQPPARDPYLPAAEQPLQDPPAYGQSQAYPVDASQPSYDVPDAGFQQSPPYETYRCRTVEMRAADDPSSYPQPYQYQPQEYQPQPYQPAEHAPGGYNASEYPGEPKYDPSRPW